MQIEVLVDFVDDVLMAAQPITARHIEAMSKLFAQRGVTRLVWGYYGDGQGGYIAPSGYDVGRHKWSNYSQVYGHGRSPLAEAVAAGHRHGQEVCAYFKPYETGPGTVFPAGSPEAERWGKLDHIGGRLVWMDPFVAEHPNLRIKHRDDPAPNVAEPIRTIRLFKKDDAPTRIEKRHVQIWTSASNYRYERAHVDFEYHETVETATADVRDADDGFVTTRGAPVRVLALSGLDLRDPYVLVTTDIKGGEADFQNTRTDMLRAYDGHGREIVGVYASGTSIYCRDRVNFRDWGLVFDYGRWMEPPLTLDSDSSGGKDGFVAFARGRNRYLTGALCETEPRVQQHWLTCLGGILDAGVDGIEFRVEGHSAHTDYTEEYGFNPAVLEQCEHTGEDVATVRGNAYTEFLREAKALIAARGKQMRVNLNVDRFGPDRPAGRRLAYPANIEFQWQRWVDEGLMDQATLRSYSRRRNLLTNSFASEMTDRCRHAGIPVAFNHHIFRHEEPWFLEEFERVRDDGRFASCILYEANTFTEYSGESDCTLSLSAIDDICKAALR